MLFHILKRDLKRKKTMNMILFLFIVLAAMFVASGVNNVVAVMNGTDYYLDKAGIGDFVIITMGDGAVGALDEILKTEAVRGYRKECVVFGSQDNIMAQDGMAVDCQNATVFQSIEASAITFFDAENNPIGDVEPGHAYASGTFLEKNGFEEGDVIHLTHSGQEMDLTLSGKAKDALLGSDLMGNTRFILSEKDMRELLDNETIYDHYRGEICYIDTEDVQGMKAAISDATNVAFDGTRSTIKMCYVMDMIVAFVVLILSVCLIIVSFVVLKFSITFTIMEEFREIGVMKAIGICDTKIRILYIVKYLALSAVGAALGFFASIPFGALLLKSVSSKMVLSSDRGIFLNLFGAAAVVAAILLFAYFCTGKVKRSSPLDAIRSGQTGERYKNKSILRIYKCPGGNAFFMALNDILSSPKRFISVMISLGLCTLFVLILVNTTATMKSPNLIHTFGKKSDLYVTDIADVMADMHAGSGEKMKEKLDGMAEELKREGMPSELCIELQYKYPITFRGNRYVFTCQQGINTEITEYAFLEGSIPQNESEIAITPQISGLTGAKIGDTVTIHYGEGDMDCMVTAYFQTMNQLGEVIRLHEDAPTDFLFIASGLAYQIDFTDSPSVEEIEVRKERIRELYDNDKVMNATEYCIDCIKAVDTLESVQILLLGITLVVVILVTILTERSFIADEKSQIAILKAIGFRDGAVIRWHVCRFGLAAFLAMVLAAVLSVPMTKLCITPIFGMMGAVDVKYHIDPLAIFALYPGIVFAMTIATAWITALYTGTIKSSDTANIE